MVHFSMSSIYAGQPKALLAPQLTALITALLVTLLLVSQLSMAAEKLPAAFTLESSHELLDAVRSKDAHPAEDLSDWLPALFYQLSIDTQRWSEVPTLCAVECTLLTFAHIRAPPYAYR